VWAAVLVVKCDCLAMLLGLLPIGPHVSEDGWSYRSCRTCWPRTHKACWVKFFNLFCQSFNKTRSCLAKTRLNMYIHPRSLIVKMCLVILMENFIWQSVAEYAYANADIYSPVAWERMNMQQWVIIETNESELLELQSACCSCCRRR